jgi:hypothetical protein
MWHIHLGTVRVSGTSTMSATLVDTMYNTEERVLIGPTILLRV